MTAMTTRRKVRWGMLVAALFVAADGPARGQSADDLFNPTRLHDVRLFINERDLQELRAHYRENTYYPADLHWGDVRVRNVGVRSRGNGSRNPVKLGLHVEFDRYVGSQRLAGLTAIDLDNLWQDPSMIREYAAMALFARAGQVAPRESFARLFINGTYQGVYAIVEPLDSSFLARVMGEASGYLFEYHWMDPYELTDLGSDLSAVEARFERRTHRTSPPAPAYSPLLEMLRAVNTVDEGLWRETIERYVDLPQFLSHVAIEQFVAELDGLTGYDGVNNFYLYRPAGSSRHQFLPWDRDGAFQDARSPLFHRAERNMLLRRALAIPALRDDYLTLLERCAELAARDRWLEGVVVGVAALLADAAAEDPLTPYDDAARATAVGHLVDFARSRPAIVRESVADARAAGSRRRR
jgi:hypothetical protein